jgi:hypothetical protein
MLIHAVAPAPARRLFGRLGARTLVYFLIGNAILLALPAFEAGSAGVMAVFLATHLALLCHK